ncbi:hypothetical protein V8E55_004784 [Tylopilus felleus]
MAMPSFQTLRSIQRPCSALVLMLGSPPLLPRCCEHVSISIVPYFLRTVHGMCFIQPVRTCFMNHCHLGSS